MKQQFEPEKQVDPERIEVRTRLGALSPIVEGTEPSEAAVQRSESAETESLTAMLEREAKLRRKEDMAGAVWAILFLVAMLSIATLRTIDVATLQRDMALCFGLLGVIGIGVHTQVFRSLSRRKRGYLKALSHAQDMKQIGSLVHTARGGSAPVRNLAKRALIELLPKLRASDASELGDAERGVLTTMLEINPRDLGHREVTEMCSPSAFRREVDLRVSILKAYEQVAGLKELSTVDKLARGVPTILRSSRIPGEIKTAAAECLPYLEARASDERASKQLLRASGPESSISGELLRAVSGASGSGEEQLLRAAEAGG